MHHGTIARNAIIRNQLKGVSALKLANKTLKLAFKKPPIIPKEFLNTLETLYYQP